MLHFYIRHTFLIKYKTWKWLLAGRNTVQHHTTLSTQIKNAGKFRLSTLKQSGLKNRKNSAICECIAHMDGCTTAKNQFLKKKFFNFSLGGSSTVQKSFTRKLILAVCTFFRILAQLLRYVDISFIIIIVMTTSTM